MKDYKWLAFPVSIVIGCIIIAGTLAYQLNQLSSNICNSVHNAQTEVVSAINTHASEYAIKNGFEALIDTIQSNQEP